MVVDVVTLAALDDDAAVVTPDAEVKEAECKHERQTGAELTLNE